jgi:WD40 repeat protein
MEKNTSATNFHSINANLKKLIFSFLNINDQRTIYWSNKKLRELLPNSALIININSLKKCSTFHSDGDVLNLLELTDGNIACWTKQGISLLKYINTECLELVKKFPFQSVDNTHPIQHNDNIIYTFCHELKICDKEFNIIEIFNESSNIYSLCNISKFSFAFGLANGKIKIYTRNPDTHKYKVKEYKLDTTHIMSLLYLPKLHFLLYGSIDGSIKVLCLSNGNVVQKLRGHTICTSSLVSINDITFASGSRNGEIKIWSIVDKSFFKLIKRIKAHQKSKFYNLHIQPLGKDFIVSKSDHTNKNGKEFKIWDLKTYKYINRYKEDSNIQNLIVTKNKNIITVLNNKLNIWKISE